MTLRVGQEYTYLKHLDTGDIIYAINYLHY